MKESLDDMLKQADILASNNNLDAAAQLNKQICDEHPDNSAVWVTLGKRYQSIEKLELAILAYKNALMIDLTQSDVAIMLSQMLIDQYQYNEAGSVLTQAISANNSSADLHLHMAGLLTLLGLHGAALTHSHAALKISPANTLTIFRHAEILENLGETEKAFITLKPLLETSNVTVDEIRLFAKMSAVLGMKTQLLQLLAYASKRSCTKDEKRILKNIQEWIEYI